MCCVIHPVEASAEPPERLTIALSASWIPYSFLNSEGEPRGMLIDLWRLFAEKNDVELAFELVDWHESLELVRRGDADVHGGLLVTETRATYLAFSSQISRVGTLLFTRDDLGYVDLGELIDQPVGIVASSFDQSFVETHFPEVTLVLFPNSEVMVDAAVRGEVEAFVADYPTGHYRLILADAFEAFQSVDTLYTEGVHAAVKNGATDLLAFVNAGIAKISKAEKVAIGDRWLIPKEPMPAWMKSTAIIGSMLLLLAASGAHYWSLRRTVRQRTDSLNNKIRELKLANERLERLAGIDSLTGVANRRAFYDRAAQEIERARRYARPLSLVLFDLDHFKQINDRLGHMGGDTVLQQFVGVVKVELREADSLARLGGDEFVTLLPETTKDEAAALARRILLHLSQQPFRHADEALTLGFSAGVAEFQDDDTIHKWMTRADARLYQSKAEGRARVSA